MNESNRPTESRALDQAEAVPPLEQVVESNRIERIEINEMNYGYTVQVGCQKFVFETPEKLIQKLTAYLKNPDEIRNRWMTKGKL